MLTNLIRNGKVTTTPQRAKVLKAEADAFFAKLIDLSTRYENEKDGKREVDRYVKSVIFGDEGKKAVNIYLPKYLEAGKKSSFIENYKVGIRK